MLFIPTFCATLTKVVLREKDTNNSLGSINGYTSTIKCEGVATDFDFAGGFFDALIGNNILPCTITYPGSLEPFTCTDTMLICNINIDAPTPIVYTAWIVSSNIKAGLALQLTRTLNGAATDATTFTLYSPKLAPQLLDTKFAYLDAAFVSSIKANEQYSFVMKAQQGQNSYEVVTGTITCVTPFAAVTYTIDPAYRTTLAKPTRIDVINQPWPVNIAIYLSYGSALITQNVQFSCNNNVTIGDGTYIIVAVPPTKLPAAGQTLEINITDKSGFFAWKQVRFDTVNISALGRNPITLVPVTHSFKLTIRSDLKNNGLTLYNELFTTEVRVLNNNGLNTTKTFYDHVSGATISWTQAEKGDDYVSMRLGKDSIVTLTTHVSSSYVSSKIVSVFTNIYNETDPQPFSPTLLRYQPRISPDTFANKTRFQYRFQGALLTRDVDGWFTAVPSVDEIKALKLYSVLTDHQLEFVQQKIEFAPSSGVYGVQYVVEEVVRNTAIKLKFIDQNNQSVQPEDVSVFTYTAIDVSNAVKNALVKYNCTYIRGQCYIYNTSVTPILPTTPFINITVDVKDENYDYEYHEDIVFVRPYAVTENVIRLIEAPARLYGGGIAGIVIASVILATGIGFGLFYLIRAIKAKKGTIKTVQPSQQRALSPNIVKM